MAANLAPVLRRLTAVLLPVASALLVVPEATATPQLVDGASIVSGEGRVRPEGGGPWQQTGTGHVLGVGIILEASSTEPLQLNLPDGVEITLEPGALGLWRPPGRLPTESNGWARGYHLELRNGEASFHLPSEPRGSRAFLVSTSAGTLTGWRGSVHLAVRGDTTAAAIYEGALVIGSNGIGFPVFEPTGVLLKKGVNPERARGIPVQPQFLDAPPPGAVSSFAVVTGQDKATLGFAWGPVPNSVSYRVEVATDSHMHDILYRGTTTQTTYSLREPDTEKKGGRYYARVRAVDEEGVVGAWSVARPLRVLHALYPPGAFVAKDGAILLPEKGFIGLPEAQGLEAAVETLRPDQPRLPLPLVSIRAPSELRLAEEGTRIYHLRDPELHAETQLVLARRELRARIDMCPRRARWPEDTVNIRIVLEDPSGRLDPAKEQVTFETSVNTNPVDAEWRHSGNTWYARVRPRPPPGPWVVRVSVKNANGTELNRGFLEVDGPRLQRARQDGTTITITR